MNETWLKAFREMRAAGYAVIVWTPEELEDTDPRWVEDQSISYANEYLIAQGE